VPAAPALIRSARVERSDGWVVTSNATRIARPVEPVTVFVRSVIF
jgi:hypothetical protein